MAEPVADPATPGRDRLGRFVFVAQWVAVIVLPIWVALGRYVVGDQPGWFSVLFLFFGAPLMALVLLIAPIVCVSSRSIRRARAVPFGFAVASVALWVLVLLASAFIVDAGDAWGPNSIAMTVLGIEAYSPGMDVIEEIGRWLIGVAVVAWLVSIVLLIAALTRRGPGAGTTGRGGTGAVALVAVVAAMGASAFAGVVPDGSAHAASGESGVRESGRVVVYYQKHFADGSGEYISPLPLVQQRTGVDAVVLAAVHMNADALLLNDDAPDAPLYDRMWADIAAVQADGVAVIGMIGGAQNDTWVNLQLDYPTQYERLRRFVTDHGLDGIDLDIETETDVATVMAVIDDLRGDFGPGFLITMSPVSAALAGEDNLSGFDYDELYRARGEDIDWFNTQFYCGWGEPTAADYGELVDYQSQEGSGVPPGKIVIAALTNPENCGDGWVPLDELETTLTALADRYDDFGGVAGWEYFNSLPGGTSAPWEWAGLMRIAIDAEPTPTPSPSPAPAPGPSPDPSASPGNVPAGDRLAATGAGVAGEASAGLIGLAAAAAGAGILISGCVRRRAARPSPWG